MRRTELLQEVWKMRCEKAYGGSQERRLTQDGVCERTSRRYVDCYEEERLGGLVDKSGAGLGTASAGR